MIKNIKLIIFGMIIGLALGLWFGVNIGKNKPLLSNPFEQQKLHEKILHSSGDLLEKSGKAIKDKLEDNNLP